MTDKLFWLGDGLYLAEIDGREHDELAPPHSHSITSSARASSAGEIARPSAFAVFRFITSSNFADCSTGRSAGVS
jgi:hypothetical protein